MQLATNLLMGLPDASVETGMFHHNIQQCFGLLSLAPQKKNGGNAVLTHGSGHAWQCASSRSASTSTHGMQCAHMPPRIHESGENQSANTPSGHARADQASAIPNPFSAV